MNQLKHAEPPTLNRDKLDAVLCFFLSKEGTDIPKTKLMKLLYFSDFGHYRKTRRPITGAQYEKMPLGPVSREALDELKRLTNEDIVVRKQQQRGDFEAQVHCWYGEDSLDGLAPEEIETLEAVWEKGGRTTTHAIVDASHQELPWLTAQMWQPIPYHAALLGDGSVS
jgi:uncharacterized phage-associated protein